MNLKDLSITDWHHDEQEWWNTFGDYMTFQWKLTPYLNRVLRKPLEADYIKYLMKRGGRILDIGCGSGWLSFHFAKLGMSVYGIDIAVEQIDAANQLLMTQSDMNIQFECTDFMGWDSSSCREEFDSIFVSAFLHHLPEIELAEAIQKIAKVVKPGGRVYLYEPLYSPTARNILIKTIDFVYNFSHLLLLDKIPSCLNLTTNRHKAELARGYRMSSPRERPINLDILESLCREEFHICSIRGWHLHSLGFAMQVTSLKQRAWRFYEPVGRLWYLLDRLLFHFFGWESLSMPGRFILCGIKLEKK